MTTTTEFFRKKDAIARHAMEQWRQTQKPVLVVVVENTANIFCCILGSEIHRLRREESKLYGKADVYLEYSWGSLVKWFEDKGWLILHEQTLMDDPTI